jgi:hypothetical protein
MSIRKKVGFTLDNFLINFSKNKKDSHVLSFKNNKKVNG